jgi:type VI secretion system protein ImpM
MSLALFGKLQIKRDFIAPGAPRAFLDVWEPWMQAGLATSRLLLGDAWAQSYLIAPIWRFWLGPRLCGSSVCGAFMPSLDAIGRHHPLAAFAVAPPGSIIPPPDVDPQEAWHRATEDFLLSTLEPNRDWGQTLAVAQALPAPAMRAVAQIEPRRLDDATLVTTFSPAAAGPAFAALAQRESDSSGGISCFWTEGGAGFPALAMRAEGLPAPERFALFLTGRDVPEPVAAQLG